MKSIPEFSIRKPATTIMFLISMIFFGYLGLKKMPVELLPNINRPKSNKKKIPRGYERTYNKKKFIL